MKFAMTVIVNGAMVYLKSEADLLDITAMVSGSVIEKIKSMAIGDRHVFNGKLGFLDTEIKIRRVE